MRDIDWRMVGEVISLALTYTIAVAFGIFAVWFSFDHGPLPLSDVLDAVF